MGEEANFEFNIKLCIFKKGLFGIVGDAKLKCKNIIPKIKYNICKSIILGFWISLLYTKK